MLKLKLQYFAENRMAMRMDWRSYMNTAMRDSVTPVWSEIGEGFTSVTESKNPTEYSRRYVHEKSDRTDVTGYAPAISYTCDMYTGDPCCLRVAKAHEREQVGTDAIVEVVNVNYFDEVEPGKFFAAKRNYSIIPDSKGDGTDAMNYSGNLNASGDYVYGLWNKATMTFTEEDLDELEIED